MKNRPTRRQADVRAQQRDVATQRRDDRESRASSAAFPRHLRSWPMGWLERLVRQVDQEAKLDEPTRTVEWLIEHPDPGRHTRVPGKRGHRSRNVPYVNPDRDAKSLRSGRLRRELQP